MIYLSRPRSAIGVNEESRDTRASLMLTLSRKGRYRLAYSEYQVVETLADGRTREAGEWRLHPTRDLIAEGLNLRSYALASRGCAIRE